MKNSSPTNIVSKIILALVIVLVGLLIFHAGEIVGYRRGTFSGNWSSSYMRGMNDPHFLFAPFTGDGDDVNPHGVIGQIVSVHLPNILIKGSNSAEQVINLSPTTTIRIMHGLASTSDLLPGGQITAIGEPRDNGSIDAVFIRIISTTSSSMPSISTSSIKK